MKGPLNLGICATLALLAGLIVISGSTAQTTVTVGLDVAIVVNPENPVNNLTMADLRRIFRGERQYWSSNSPVVLLMHAPGARERDVVLRSVLQMSEEEYTQYWVAKIMRAEASFPPTAVFSHAMVREGSRGNRGAIGYVVASDVPVGLKVLQVDGLLPGKPGYPLH
jgi:ABC-type phosphate transport system substrate-binding protein